MFPSFNALFQSGSSPIFSHGLEKLVWIANMKSVLTSLLPTPISSFLLLLCYLDILSDTLGLPSWLNDR